MKFHLHSFGIFIFSIFCCSPISFAAKRVLNQNGCIAVIEAHPKQRYPFVYLVQSNEKSVRARVLFRNPDTWQIRLESDCDWDWVGSPTFAMKKVLQKPVEDEDTDTGREGQTVAFGMDIGMGLTPLPTVGFYGNYFISEDDVFELSYMTGALDILVFRLEGTLISGKYKKFWGNSFYTNLGIGQRTYRATSPLLNAVAGSNTFDASVQSIVLDFSIGNRWQWDSFHIGCDWIGALLPLGEPQTTFKTEDSSSSTDDKAKKEGDLYSTGKASTTSMWRLVIGFAF